jgi:hypothetical protein
LRAGIAPAGEDGITGRAVLARAGAAGDRVVEQPGLLRARCATRSLRETIAHKLHTDPLRFFASSCGGDLELTRRSLPEIINSPH